MTREEKISKAAYSQYCNSESICFTLMCDSFKQGAKWADEHPKSPWISVKDDLPCNHKELMRSSFFTRTVLALSDGIGHEFARMHKTATDGWGWTSIRNVKYWMPIPKFQKE